MLFLLNYNKSQNIFIITQTEVNVNNLSEISVHKTVLSAIELLLTYGD